MGQDPAVIRKEIEQTRDHMGETVDALGYKADVPARTKESITDKVDTLKSKLSGVGAQVSDATPEAEDVKHGAQQAVGIVQENPLGLALGAAAVGFLAGAVIPHTKIEDERLGPAAEQVREQARETGEEALEHGKQVVHETADTVSTKTQEAVSEVQSQAQESAQQHAQQVADKARASAQEVAAHPQGR